MARGKNAVNEDGAPVKRRTYSRKPKAAGETADGDVPPKKTRRAKKPSAATAVFGAHDAVFERTVSQWERQADVAKIMRKHLANLMAEIGGSGGEFGKAVIDKLTQCGADLIAEAAKKPYSAPKLADDKKDA